VIPLEVFNCIIGCLVIVVVTPQVPKRCITFQVLIPSPGELSITYSQVIKDPNTKGGEKILVHFEKPTDFGFKDYLLYFYAGDGIEPIHVHVAPKRPSKSSAKF